MRALITSITLALCVGSLALAQETSPSSAAATSGTKPTSPDGAGTLEQLLTTAEERLKAIEADATLDDAAKGVLRTKYQQAIDELKKALSFSQLTAEYRTAIQSGLEQASQLIDSLNQLPEVEDAGRVDTFDSIETLKSEVDSQRGSLITLNSERARIGSKLIEIRARPLAINDEIRVATQQLANAQAELKSPELAEDPDSPGRTADRLVKRAQELRSSAELEMLKQEQASQSIRENVLLAQQQLTVRQAENAAARLNALETKFLQTMTQKAHRLEWLADTTTLDVPTDDGKAQALVAEVQDLAKQLEQAVQQLKGTRNATDRLTEGLSDLDEGFRILRQQVELGNVGEALASVLISQRHAIQDLRSDAFASQSRSSSVAQSQLNEITVADKLRRQAEFERQFSDYDSESIQRLLEARRELLEDLSTQYSELIRVQAQCDSVRRECVDKTSEMQTFIAAQLFWSRSVPPLGMETATGFPDGFRWLVQPEHASELLRSLRNSLSQQPLNAAAMFLLLLVLVATRPRTITKLQSTGTEIRRISTDRYVFTVRALLFTLILALPAPLVVGYCTWLLSLTPAPSPWIQGLSGGLRMVAWMTLCVSIAAAICRRDGLGTAHFGWNVEVTDAIRRALWRFAIVVFPATLITHGTEFEDTTVAFKTVGRLSFILAQVWIGLVAGRLIRDLAAIDARNHDGTDRGVFGRYRMLWLAMAVTIPGVLIILAALGYANSAIRFASTLLATLALLGAGVLVYWLTLRWFMINERRLALDEALAKRRARREAMSAGQQTEESAEVISIAAEEEKLDLDSIGKQTRHVLRLFSILFVSLAVGLLWSNTVPLLTSLDSVSVPFTSGMSVLSLIEVVVIAIVTYVAVQNLPGLIELAILRTVDVDSGTRHAIATLCRYAVLATGAALALNVMRLDWVKFGWIVAALSVGLGFGLQEVVANFVCGLVLLFERPIRVGDVVTVDQTTGTVTKIRMRATTITNWDRQEFVVPNKNLITNTILNWTLSSAVNRIVIPVGIAYGSDTDRAREMLLKIAGEHPVVLDDPPPMAAFDRFGDSTLQLRLLAFLPDVENRLKVITELHTQIHRQFADAGIEIAFPQLDLHLRR